MEKEKEGVASERMGSSPINEDESVAVQANTSEFLNNTTIESQESHIILPVLRDTEKTRLSAAWLEKTEIPDSDAVSDFSSPVKPSSSLINHNIAAASPPKIGTWDQFQETKSDAEAGMAVSEEISVPVVSSAEVPFNVPNSSPPLMRGFTSSPMTQFKQSTATHLAAAGMAQLGGLALMSEANSHDNAIISEDMQESVTLINLPKLLTSLPELELVRTEFGPSSTYDGEFTANIEDSSVAAAIDLGDGQETDATGTDKVVSPIGQAHGKPNSTPIELPKNDSQYFDEAWREITGTQKLPDSDVAQDASQARNTKEISNELGLPCVVGKDIPIAEINSLQAPMEQKLSPDGSLHFGNESYADPNTIGENPQETSDAGLIRTQEELPDVLLVTSQTTENTKIVSGNGKEVKEVGSQASSDEEVARFSIPHNLPQDTTVAIDLDSIISFPTTQCLESNNVHAENAAVPATTIAFSQTTSSEPDSSAVMEILDFDHDLGRDAIQNRTSIVENNLQDLNIIESELKECQPTIDPETESKQGAFAAQHEARFGQVEGHAQKWSDITMESQSVERAKLGTKISAQTENVGHQPTHKSSNLDEDTAVTVEVGTEIYPSEKSNDRKSLRTSNTPTQARTVLPSITSLAPVTKQKLEILDSDDEPMSDDLFSEQQAHEVTNREPSGDVTKSTPLFGETTVAIASFGSEVGDKATTQNEDVEMTSPDEERQKLDSPQTLTSTGHAQDLPDGASQKNEEPQKRRKRVIPDSDDEDGDEADENLEREPVLPLAYPEPARTPLASSIEIYQSPSIAIAGSISSPPKVTPTPTSLPIVGTALPPSQKKSTRTSNASFRLPTMSKEINKDSLSSSPVKSEGSSSFISRAGDQAAEGPGSNDVVIAELKAMKIASLKARNAALTAEIANKRAKLEEVNKTLKKPAAETVKTHIKLLHDYNDIRDVGQGLIGMIADNRGVRIGELYDEFGVNIKD